MGNPGAPGRDGNNGMDGIGIDNITADPATPGQPTTVRVDLSDGSEETFMIQPGAQGVPGTNGMDGARGASVASVNTIQAGTTTTPTRIQFTESDGDPITGTVSISPGPRGQTGRDGMDGMDGGEGPPGPMGLRGFTGQDGDTISNITAMPGGLGFPTPFTITLSDGSEYTFEIPAGATGRTGLTGRGIQEVSSTANPQAGSNTTVTVTYTDSTTETFLVPPGAPGVNAVPDDDTTYTFTDGTNVCLLYTSPSPRD